MGNDLRMNCLLRSVTVMAMMVFASCTTRCIIADDAVALADAEFERLLNQLGSDSFIQRDWAARRLMSHGPSMVPAIREDNGTEAALGLLSRMSQATDAGLASLAVSGMTTLRDEPDELPDSVREPVDTAYREAIRPSIAQLTLLGADIVRDDGQSIVHIKIHSNQFDDRHVRLLVPLTTLHSLDLRDTEITNEGLKQLASLQRLATLNLSDTRVTSSGLRELASFRELRQLIVYRFNLTREDIDWLREHLPGCKVNNR